ncbi:MAG: sugar porter family MFS transporter [Candidatus Eremiobacterota bacterium]
MSQKKNIVYFVAFAAATAGLLFGLDVGVISGAQKFIEEEWKVTPVVMGQIVAGLLWGATLGALLSGFVSAALGRKKTMLIAAVLFVVGSVGCALATSPGMLIGLRVFLGLGVGMASFIAPLYLSEVAPQRMRGSMVSMYQLLITIGIVVAQLSDAYFASYATIGGQTGGHWRWMLGVLALPASLMFLAVLTLPESPRWLLMKGREEDCRGVLDKVRSSEEEIQQEIGEIKRDLKLPQNGLELFLQNANFRRACFLGFALQTIQQLTGINVVIYYMPKIIEVAGFSSTTEQMWGNVLMGVVNVLSTFIAIAFVDRWGRKPIMYAGFVVMGAAMTTVGAIFHMGVDSGPSLPYIAIGGLLVFILGFAMSAGPIVWILCSEIYPLNGRDFGVTVSTGTNWIVNGIVGASFPVLLGTLGPGNTFLLYGGLEVLFIVFFVLYVPETRGVSLERISENLMNGKPLRELGT